MRERILGSDNVEIPHPIVYRGAVYADGLQFSRSVFLFRSHVIDFLNNDCEFVSLILKFLFRGISLWQRALDLKQRNNREAVSDIYRFAEVSISINKPLFFV